MTTNFTNLPGCLARLVRRSQEGEGGQVGPKIGTQFVKPEDGRTGARPYRVTTIPSSLPDGVSSRPRESCALFRAGSQRW